MPFSSVSYHIFLQNGEKNPAGGLFLSAAGLLFEIF